MVDFLIIVTFTLATTNLNKLNVHIKTLTMHCASPFIVRVLNLFRLCPEICVNNKIT